MAIGRTNAGGSGTSLNFKVVGGTTPPTSPKENTIWVNTDVAIPSWAFSTTEPGSPAAGMVWISTGTRSPVAFNALKKNAITVCPQAAKQYVSGQWVNVEAQTYKDAAWESWTTDIVLYDGGKKDIGLKYQNASDRGTYIDLTLNKNSNSESKAATVKSDSIYLTGLSTYQITYGSLSGEGTFAGYIKAVVWAEDGSTKVKESTAHNIASGTCTVDISGLSGKYVVGVYAYNTSGSYAGSVRVTKMEALIEASTYAQTIAELDEEYVKGVNSL